VTVERKTTTFVLNNTEKHITEGTQQVLLDPWRRTVPHTHITKDTRKMEELSQDTADEVILSIGNNFSINSQWNASSAIHRQQWAFNHWIYNQMSGRLLIKFCVH
jgi:S-formylglutathione hydrolase FrmB